MAIWISWIGLAVGGMLLLAIYSAWAVFLFVIWKERRQERRTKSGGIHAVSPLRQ